MSAIQFVARDAVGNFQQGTVLHSDISESISLAAGGAVSLNIRRLDVSGYLRQGDDLVLILVDGRKILLEDYYGAGGDPQAELFLNEGGTLIATKVSATSEVSHMGTEEWGKWGELSAMTFPDDPVVLADSALSENADVAVAEALSDSSDTEGTMLAGFGLAPLGALTGTGTGVLLGAGALGATAVLTGGVLRGGSSTGGDGSGDTSGTDSSTGSTIDPAIDRADDNYEFNYASSRSLTITGVAEPNSEIEVSIGGRTVITRSDAYGRWSAEFTGTNFPPDGEYRVTAVVIEPDGTRTELDGQTIVVDTVPPEVDVTGYDGVDGLVINAVENNAGFSLEGNGEAGADVTIRVNGITRSTTVSSNGTWSIPFNPGELPTGEYDIDVSITSTDDYGNATTITHTMTIDTVAPDLVIDSPQAVDNTINASERIAGVEITGTAEPGADVDVTMNGVTYSTTATHSGTWSVTFAPSDIPAGDYETNISVRAEDAAGNISTSNSTIQIDTDGAVTLSAGAGAGGEILVNAAAQSSTVLLSGTVEAGSDVSVTVEGSTYSASVFSNGSWILALPGSALPTGDYTTAVVVNATDGAGNQTTTSGIMKVDTENSVTISSGHGGADGVINGVEAAGGVTFTGTGEVGASVVVSFQGNSHAATVDAAGNWSVTFPGTQVPDGSYSAPISVFSTDVMGNTTSATAQVEVDTYTSVTATLSGAGADGIVNAAEATAGLTLTGMAESGAAVDVTIGGVTHSTTAAGNGSWSVTFASGTIAPGEYQADVTVTAEDAAGNTATATTQVSIDTLVTDFAFTGSPTGGDGAFAGHEFTGGLSMTGTVEIGSSVNVTLGGVTRSASVAGDGTWTVTFEEGSVPGGEYDTLLSVQAVDGAGNTATLTESVRIDTDAGDLALSPGAIEIDDIVNHAERADGVDITGTATPGLTVTVSLGTATTTVVSDPAGNWSVTFPAGDVPTGTGTADIVASITDSYGNSKTVSDVVGIDTVVDNFTSAGATDVDGVINAVEHADGVTLTGTVEQGSTVSVRVGLVTRSANVDAAGNWSVDFDANDVPTGETTLDVLVTATDGAGNTATRTDSVEMDTMVNQLAINGAIAGDGYINADEAASGLTITGVVEQGSSVQVTMDGITRTANVDASGNWSVYYAPGEIGTGEEVLGVSVTATDAAGNTETITDSVTLDTVAPEEAYVTAFNRAGDVLRGFSVDAGDATAELTTLAPDGSQGSIGNVQFANPVVAGEIDFYFTEALPNGSHLVINKADAAGNSSATLFALDEGLPDAVDLSNPGLTNHEIETVDLRFAEDSTLTISSDVLEGLSDNSNTLTIHGSADDEVRIDTTNGAAFTDTNTTVQIGGETYSIYTLGDEGGTLIIDQDITIT